MKPLPEVLFVVGFDTNIVVRLLVNDDLKQTKQAERAFVEHTKKAGVFLSLVVLVETVWVLSVGYGLTRSAVSDLLVQLTATRGVFVEEPDLVAKALSLYRRGKADFADYVIAGRAQTAGVHTLFTFDRKFAREKGVRLLE